MMMIKRLSRRKLGGETNTGTLAEY